MVTSLKIIFKIHEIKHSQVLIQSCLVTPCCYMMWFHYCWIRILNLTYLYIMYGLDRFEKFQLVPLVVYKTMMHFKLKEPYNFQLVPLVVYRTIMHYKLKEPYNFQIIVCSERVEARFETSLVQARLFDQTHD